jgi:glycosyltransferase involved in cell wall biosynthesis
MNNLKRQEPRVLHLISSSGFLGAENVVLELSKEMTKAGFWVTIGILENKNNLHMELAERARAEGIEVQIFPCKGRFDTKTISSIRSFINSEQPNIMHSHGYKSNFYAWRALSGLNIPWIVTNHGKRFGMKLSIYNWLNIFFMGRADKVIAVSKDIADEMMKKAIPSAKILVIDNGIDLQKFEHKTSNNDLRKSLGLNGNHKFIGTVASLTEEKGHVYLIEGARQVIDKYAECCFLIVGEGNQRHFLEEKISAFGLKGKMIFTGSRKDVPQILPMLDAFILPSLKEGLPMALLEAMAVKVPVIATKVGAIPNVIEDGINGILIPPKNSDAIADAINRMLSNRYSAKEMANRGFEKVRDHYSADIMARKYLAIYKDLLS